MWNGSMVIRGLGHVLSSEILARDRHFIKSVNILEHRTFDINSAVIEIKNIAVDLVISPANITIASAKNNDIDWSF